MANLPPLSLYIHIPWCVQKCPYCDFNSHALKGEVPHDDYVQHLLNDLQADAHYAQGREIGTIFIGGGTPSLLSGPAMHDIEEALLLCERVLVMSPRPGRIIAEFALPLAFPRHRDNPQLLQHRQDILRILGQEADW